MKDLINEYLFYIFDCLMVTIIAIFIVYAFHDGNVSFLLIYASGLLIISTLIGNLYIILMEKYQKYKESKEEVYLNNYQKIEPEKQKK